jgi:hypothetical protein
VWLIVKREKGKGKGRKKGGRWGEMGEGRRETRDEGGTNGRRGDDWPLAQ